jgi:hypothetical protein
MFDLLFTIVVWLGNGAGLALLYPSVMPSEAHDEMNTSFNTHRSVLPVSVALAKCVPVTHRGRPEA